MHGWIRLRGLWSFEDALEDYRWQWSIDCGFAGFVRGGCAALTGNGNFATSGDFDRSLTVAILRHGLKIWGPTFITLATKNTGCFGVVDCVVGLESANSARTFLLMIRKDLDD